MKRRSVCLSIYLVQYTNPTNSRTSAPFPLEGTVHATWIERPAPVLSYPMETTTTRQYRQIFWDHPSLNHSSPPPCLPPPTLSQNMLQTEDYNLLSFHGKNRPSKKSICQLYNAMYLTPHISPLLSTPFSKCTYATNVFSTTELSFNPHYLTTGPQPLPKPFPSRVQSCAFFQYFLVSLTLCSYCWRLLPHLLVTPIPPFPSITCFIKQFLSNI
jgi:hypothetical protein